MSEYPVSCDKCGCYIGYVHATEWSEGRLCSKCYLELQREKERIQ